MKRRGARRSARERGRAGGPSAVVVVAASSGGLAPLRALASQLPPRFPAAVLVVSHTGPKRDDKLPTLLSAAGPLRASHAADGQALEEGKILVAPAGRHLVVTRRQVRLTDDPEENGVRPAADVLFRSAARAFGGRALGVVLSGNGCDGAGGLAAIGTARGITVVQEPEDARFPSMPLAALAAVTLDACVPGRAIGAAVEYLIRERLGTRASAVSPSTESQDALRVRDALRASANRGRQARAESQDVETTVRSFFSSKAIVALSQAKLTRTREVIDASKRRTQLAVRTLRDAAAVAGVEPPERGE